MKRKTIFNLLIILVILSFFVTPLGYESKIFLQRIFANSVDILPKNEQYTIDYNWILKDKNNQQFSFEKSKGKPVFVYFWASWNEKSIADLSDIQSLYDQYNDKVDFYLITNELPQPVEELMQKRGYNFKVTYLIMSEKSPFDAKNIPSGYIIDKEGKVVAQQEGVTDWDSKKVRELLNKIIQ